MACVAKVGSSQEPKSILDSVNKAPSKTLIIPSKDLVQIVAKVCLFASVFRNCVLLSFVYSYNNIHSFYSRIFDLYDSLKA